MNRFVVSALATSITLLLGGSLALADAPRDAASTPKRFVRDAQRTLRELGYRPGPVDGVVGPRTQEALARYQRAEGIPGTRQLDTETMGRLETRERVLRSARAAGG